MKNSTGKRLLALFLCFVMCVSLLPVPALAEDEAEEKASIALAEEAAEDGETFEEEVAAEPAGGEASEEADEPEAETFEEKARTAASKPSIELDTDRSESAGTISLQEDESAPEEGSEGAIITAARDGDPAAAEIDVDRGEEDLLDAYAVQQLYAALPDTFALNGAKGAQNNAGSKLSGLERIAYDLLKGDIADVAAGMRTSTVFSYSYEEFGISQTTWTAEELDVDSIEVDGNICEEAIAAAEARLTLDLAGLLDALQLDFPYELYWYDKTASTGFSFADHFEFTADELTAIGGYTFSFPVALDFSDGEYTTIGDPGQTINNAIAYAASIVSECSAYADYEKLEAYKNTICELASYNNEAAAGDEPYGNPWQIIWVFDENPETEVVCEGYAKAFKYLCDLSAFESDKVSACCVTGNMSDGTGAGPHMWNIVTMDNGKIYLVDVTNCDDDNGNYSDDLFLAGYASGSVEEGYVFTFFDGEIEYIYDESMYSSYSIEELTISDKAYTEEIEYNYPELIFDEEAIATIGNPGDYAYFQFTPAESGEYVFLSRDSDSQDTVGYLYDSGNNQLAYNDDGGNGNNFQITYSLQENVTYILGVRFYSKDRTGSFPVAVTVMPEISSISAAGTTAKEGANGYYQETNGRTWFHYNAVEPGSIVVEMADGTIFSGDLETVRSEFYSQCGCWIDFSYHFVSDQSYENPFIAGRSYEAEITALGKTVKYWVAIEANPIAAISADSLTIYEGTHGGYNTTAGEKWFCYSAQPDHVTVTTKDGQTLEGSLQAVQEQLRSIYGEWYSSNYTITGNQSYESQLSAGETYTARLTINGRDASYEVTIIESPIISVTAEGTVCREENNGYYRETAAGERWFYYYETAPGRVSVETTEGIFTGTISEVQNQLQNAFDAWFESCCGYTEQQSYETRFEAGESYSAFLMIGVARTDYTVTIEESLIESLTAEGTTIYEETHGSYSGTGERRWFCYDNVEPSYVTVSTTDGAFFEGSFWEVYYQLRDAYGEEFRHSWPFTEEQHYNSRFEAGQSYEAVLSLGDKTATYQVTILANPIVSVEAEAVTFYEGSNGYYDLAENGEKWFRYDNPVPSWVTVTTSDGETYTGYYWDVLSRLRKEYGEQITESHSFPTYQSYWNQLKTGESYSAEVTINGRSASYEVTIAPNPIASIEVPDTYMYEENGGELRETETGESWYCYYVLVPGGITVTTIDGRVYEEQTIEEIIEELRKDYGCSFSWYIDYTAEQSYEHPFLPGETYAAELTLGMVSGFYEVTIRPNPIASIVAENVTVYEGSDGYYYEDYESGELWFRFDRREPTVTVTMADGTVFNGPFWNVHNKIERAYKWFDYDFNYTDSQSYETPFSAGHTYEAYVMLNGRRAAFSVTIAPSPIAELEAADNTIPEGLNCSFEETETGETWIHYSGTEPGSVTVTTTDGKPYSGTLDEVREALYEDYGCWFYYDYDFTTEQSSGDPFEAGNTYNAVLKLGTAEANYRVTIEESPIGSVTLATEDPAVAYNGITGYYIGTENGESWFYYGCPEPEITVMMRDGGTYTGKPSQVSSNIQNDYGYYFSYENDYTEEQSENNRFEAGQVYNAQLNFGGKSLAYEVMIADSPIISVAVEDMTLYEYISGEYLEAENGEEWFCYWAYSPQRITVKTVDGKTHEGYLGEVQSKLEALYGVYFDYDWRYTVEQSYRHPFEVGQSYPAELTFGGKTAIYQVKIEPNPIASVEAKDVTLYEDISGYFEETSNGETWFRYYPVEPQITLTTIDGKKYEGSIASVQSQLYRGYDYWFEYDCNYANEQSYENQLTVGETFTVNMTFARQTVSFRVTIAGNPIVSVEVTESSPSYKGISGYYEKLSNGETWFRYYSSVPVSISVTTVDGETHAGTYNQVCRELYNAYSNGTGLSISYTFVEEQSYEHQFEIGKSYAAAFSMAGKQAEYQVEIKENPIAEITATDVSIFEHSNGYDMDSGSWFRYYAPAPGEVTVRTTNGNTYEGEIAAVQASLQEVYGSAIWFDAWYKDEQSYEHQFEAEHTYDAALALGSDVQTTYRVTIKANPITSITVPEAVTLHDGLDGAYVYSEYYGCEIFAYDDIEPSTITVITSGGTYTGTPANVAAQIEAQYGVPGKWEVMPQDYQELRLGTNEWQLSFCGMIVTYTITVLPLTYEDPVYEWSEDNSSVTATAVCTESAEKTIVETVQAVYDITKAATCMEDGVGTWTAVFENEVFTTQTKTVVIEMLAHSYGEPGYTWTGTEDGFNCTATVTCSVGHETVTEPAVVSYEETTAPTCVTEGEGVYTATFENALFSEQTKTVRIEKLAHSYGEPSYTWTKTEDGWSCTAAAVCSVGNETVTETAAVSYKETPAATCTEEGVGTWTAVFRSEAFTTQTKTETVPALGHKPGEPVHENEVPATETSEGSYDEVIYCTVCEKELGREHRIVPKITHVIASGECGTDLTWTLTDKGELTITGTGAMTNWNAGTAPWYSNRSDIRTVVIEDGVTTIGNHAFNGCAALTAVMIPESVTSVGSSAFANGTALTEVTYAGDEADWKAVQIGVNNENLTRTAITCSDGTKEPAALEPEIAVTTEGYLVKGKAVSFSGSVKAEEDAVASWTWAFGDGASANGRTASHTYTAGGTHTVNLTVTDIKGRSYTEEFPVEIIDVTEPGSEYSKLTFSIVNANDLSAVNGAQITVTGTGTEAALVTANGGKASCIVENGAYTVTVMANNFMMRTVSINVLGGEKEYTIGLTKTGFVSGELTTKELTYEEIVAAGIDVTDPANNHVTMFETTITFVAGFREYELPSVVYKNEKKETVKSEPVTIDIDIDVEIEDEPEPGGGGGSGSSSGGGGGHSFWPSKIRVTVYPITEKFALVIYGEAHWLKEMFQATLVVHNDSLTDTLEDTVATLSLPDGLSLAAMTEGTQTLTQVLGTIEGGDCKEAVWYIRGDAEGEYYLTADVTATSMPFGDEIHALFETTQPIKVYAGSALHLTITADDLAIKGKDYIVSFQLENVSNKPIYGLSFGIKNTEQSRILRYRDTEDWTVIAETEGDEPWTRYYDEFAPGDSLDIDISILIEFDSDLEALSILPFVDINYYFSNLTVAFLSDSTTEIPWDYVLRHVDPDYDGYSIISQMDKDISNYLAKPSTVYNPELACFMMGLAKGAYNKNDIYLCLKDLGFTSVKQSKDYNTWTPINNATAAYSLAKKQMDDGSMLVMVVVRGTKGYEEWVSTDFNVGYTLIGNVGLHEGFADSMNVIYNDLEAFLGGIPTDNVTYMLTGHSLGAAMANLVSAMLVINGGVPASNIYDYNFACPDVIRMPIVSVPLVESYANQFNIADARDPVSFVPGLLGDVVGEIAGAESGKWGKFGVSRWFSRDWSVEENMQLTVSAHFSENYVSFFRGRPAFDTFKTRLDTALRNPDIYKRKLIVIHCPVDVIVYNSNGNPVAGVIDGVPNYYDSEFGDVIIGTSGDEKAIILPENGEYTVKLTGTDTGEMRYEVMNADLVSREIEEQKTFDKVALTAGKEMISEVGTDTEVPEVKLFVLGKDDTPVIEVAEDGTETRIDDGKELVLSADQLTIVAGKTATLTAEENDGTAVMPTWSSSDEEVVVVNEKGIVTAKKAGKAVITATVDDFSAECEVLVQFTDVTDSTRSFYAPVYWALENGITTGTSKTTFSPDNSCTRAQIVTFLWRLKGKPEPKSMKSPFTDVTNPNASYYKPVLWALENGITTGTSKTTFSPTKPCTRAQSVTFLWRALGCPEPSTTKSPFKDVTNPNASFYKAVLWALENGITTGTSKTTFSPNNTCTRGQIVTFLYRYNNLGPVVPGGSLKIWAPEGTVEFTKEQVAVFMDEHPEYDGYTISIEPVSEGEATDKILADVKAGADIFNFPQDQLARLVSGGVLTELSEKNAVAVAAENDAGSVAAASMGGTIYAYPLTSDNGYFLYYDKSVVTDPTSLDIILEDCQAAGKNFYMEINSGWYQPAFFFGAGCTLTYDTDDSGNFTACNIDYASDKGVGALKAMIRLAQAPSFRNGSSISNATDAAAIVDGTWDSGAAKELFGSNYACAKLPMFDFDGTPTQMGGFGGFKLLGVKTQTDETKRALCDELALFLSGRDVQLARYNSFGWGPSNSSAKADPAVQADEALAALGDQLNYSIPQGQYPGNYWGLASALGDSVIAGEYNEADDAELLAVLQSFQDACISYAG